jgi:hypothetical protein
LNCPNCDKEILAEDTTFCPQCGESLETKKEMQQNQTDLVLAAALLTIVASSFSSGLGGVSLYQYVSLLSYYEQSLLEGFLILGVTGIIVSAVGLVGGIFMLKRKSFKISMLGVIVLVFSVIGNYIIIQHYQYGFTDLLLLSIIAILMLSILSGVLVFTSKNEFT